MTRAAAAALLEEYSRTECEQSRVTQHEEVGVGIYAEHVLPRIVNVARLLGQILSRSGSVSGGPGAMRSTRRRCCGPGAGRVGSLAMLALRSGARQLAGATLGAGCTMRQVP
jgi:hypothetical protein